MPIDRFVKQAALDPEGAVFNPEEVKAIVNLPPEVSTFALMPIGYPRDKFGPVRRKPLSAVAIRDRWGNPWQG